MLGMGVMMMMSSALIHSDIFFTYRDYKEYHTDTTVKFVIKMNKDKLLKAEESGLHKFFKLQTTMTQQSTMVRSKWEK